MVMQAKELQRGHVMRDPRCLVRIEDIRKTTKEIFITGRRVDNGKAMKIEMPPVMWLDVCGESGR